MVACAKYNSMNTKAHLESLQELIAPYQDIWGRELLHHYPDGLAHYPTSWLEDVAKLSHYDQWRLNCGDLKPVQNLNSSLKNLLLKLREFLNVPKAPWSSQAVPSAQAFFKIKHKKQHEITAILAFLEYLKEHHQIDLLLDLGAGQGHLARLFVEHLGLDCHCLEMNPELITLGLNKLKKRPLNQGRGKIHFHSICFDQHSELPVETKTSRRPLLIGLHTCGPLALHQLATHQRGPQLGLLNFGCCYQKLDAYEQTNLSGEVSLPWTPFALTLATRAHGVISYHDFCHTERVKLYRYGLHLFIKDFFQQTHFQTVGDSPSRDYLRPFADYLAIKLNDLQLSSPIPRQQIQTWFNQAHIQQELRQLFCANLIRWRFGRALELILLWDRVRWLEKAGRQAQLLSFFDEGLSPRNLGIVSLP